MKDKIEKHADKLVTLVGALVKSLCGDDANFILIPIIEHHDDMEMAIMTSMEMGKSAFILSEATIESIKAAKEEGYCGCPACMAKTKNKVVNISKNLH